MRLRIDLAARHGFLNAEEFLDDAYHFRIQGSCDLAAGSQELEAVGIPEPAPDSRVDCTQGSLNDVEERCRPILRPLDKQDSIIGFQPTEPVVVSCLPAEFLRIQSLTRCRKSVQRRANSQAQHREQKDESLHRKLRSRPLAGPACRKTRYDKIKAYAEKRYGTVHNAVRHSDAGVSRTAVP